MRDALVAGRQFPAGAFGEGLAQSATVGTAFIYSASEATNPDGDGIVYTAALPG